MTMLAVITCATVMAAKDTTFPEGKLETCKGGDGCIHVSGWAYFVDTPNTSILVRAFVYTDQDLTQQYGDYHDLTTDQLRIIIPEEDEHQGHGHYEIAETIYDGVTTVTLQKDISYSISQEYATFSYPGFLLDNNTCDAKIPYAGGTGAFYEIGNSTSQRAESGRGQCIGRHVGLPDKPQRGRSAPCQHALRL